jgi:hypothetical protein
VTEEFVGAVDEVNNHVRTRQDLRSR